MNKKTATLALIVHQDHLLLGLKVRKGADIGEGTLNGPGGKVEEGQTLIDCLITEVKDEVGITPARDSDEVAVLEFHNGERSYWEVHVYLVTTFTGVPRDTDEMVSVDGTWWYPIGALPFHRMLASDHLWIPRVLAGERLRMKVYQNDDASVLLDDPLFSSLA